MSELWEGWDVDIWGPIQTLKPRALQNASVMMYSGYDEIGYITAPSFANIPLDVRYANFRKRLDSVLSIKHNQRLM